MQKGLTSGKGEEGKLKPFEWRASEKKRIKERFSWRKSGSFHCAKGKSRTGRYQTGLPEPLLRNEERRGKGKDMDEGLPLKMGAQRGGGKGNEGPG